MLGCCSRATASASIRKRLVSSNPAPAPPRIILSAAKRLRTDKASCRNCRCGSSESDCKGEIERKKRKRVMRDDLPVQGGEERTNPTHEPPEKAEEPPRSRR